MSTKIQFAKMHHLTLVQEQKINHLFEVVEKIKQLQKSENISKVVVLTHDNLSADYLSCQLNLNGTVAASIHSFKSPLIIQKTMEGFNNGSIEVLVTDKVDFLRVKSVQHLINFDMFVPNILYCENYKSDDVFHIQKKWEIKFYKN